MMRKLRLKLLATCLAGMMLVFGAIFVVSAVRNQSDLTRDSDAIIDFIVANGGMSPKDSSSIPIDTIDKSTDSYIRQTPDLQYETRYFVVTISSDGTASADVTQTSSVSDDAAVSFAQEALSSGSERGNISTFRYRVVESDEETMLVFLDRARQSSLVRETLMTELQVAAAGGGIVLLLVWMFSRRIVQPIVDGQEKQKRFITDAGHDIKTPLTIISADADVLEIGRASCRERV